MFTYSANNDNFGRRRNSWIERRVSDRKVAGLMSVLRINANYLTGTLCEVEDICFTTAFTAEKMKYANYYPILNVYNYPMLNVNDIVPSQNDK